MFDSIAKIFAFVTLFLAAAAILGFILLKSKNKAAAATLSKYAAGFAVGYVTAVGAALFLIQWHEDETSSWLDPGSFYPILGLAALIVVLSIIGIIVSNLKKDKLKLYSLIALGLVAIYVAVLLSVFPFAAYDKPEYTGGEKAGLIATVLVAIAALVAVPLIFGKKIPEKLHSKAVVYAAISIALGFALSYLKLFSLPNGGSVTIAGLLPLMLYSYMFGIRRGAAAGFIYGILQFIQEPFFLDPWQFILEYPLAFGFIGLAGLLREINVLSKTPVLQILIGGILVAVLRFLCHFIAGFIVWANLTADGIGAVAYSLTYNLSYVFPDMLIALAAAAALFASRSFRATLTIA
ncbi:MAG: energy-coupled thiamine transporter ThiT [Clostridiales bacterium]|nr:energy-coupled thiamine transporter ThiT [Clostridiales bacterium]